MLRFVPPAGAPLKITQILRALRHAVTDDGHTEDFLKRFASRLRVRHVLAVSSGRAALFVILRALHRLRPERDIVAVPAYTCFSVAASVVRAGLRLHPVDIDPETLDLNYSHTLALPPDRLLCILTCNLFGFVNDVPRIRQIARAKGTFLVDDAAQALGASRGSLLAGTMGDVGLYSFGRGKALPAGEGGLIVTDSDEIADAVGREVEALPTPSTAHTAHLLLQVLAYAVFLRPRLYWIPNSLPFLKLGITEFKPNFPACRLPSFPRALIPGLLDRLAEINQVRIRHADKLARAFADHPDFRIPQPAQASQPIYIRFPVIARDEATRVRALARLRAAGIGASAFYPTAICDIAGIEKYMVQDEFHRPRAEELARRLFTLPTHPFVSQADLDRIIEALRAL
jgi:dTDP-4-amino-4,6-dideoxygalactose transaminase